MHQARRQLKLGFEFQRRRLRWNKWRKSVVSAGSSGWLEDHTLIRRARECRLFSWVGEMKEARGLRRLPAPFAPCSRGRVEGNDTRIASHFGVGGCG